MLFRLYFLIVLLIPAFLEVNCGKQFRLGRAKGGNLGAPQGVAHEEVPPAKWFKQKLDHSAPTDLRTWKQRYFINDTFYDNKSGPVFLMVGGEGPADPRWMVKGTWIDYARKFRAMCIMLEHRYYGESHPTDDVSTKNLQYLSSYQALADVANFISSMNIEYGFDPSRIKWVAFGGSYPGSLAAWLRVKYPHLVFASVSSSGPLLAKLDFKEYYEVVANAIQEKTTSSNCLKKVRAGHKQVVALMNANPRVLDKEFRTCKPLSTASKNDIKNFYNGIADDFAELVQYNEDNRMSLNTKYKNITINTVCDMLINSNDTALKALAKFNSIMLDKSNQTCMDYSYDSMIREMRNISWTSTEGGRQWIYQTCTEFGFYQTSSGEVDLFGDQFGIDFFVQQCVDIFGKKFNKDFINKGIKWTNSEYGAMEITAPKVVYVHGSVDPWHALGMTKTRANDAPAIFVKGSAHCADMYPGRDSDIAELVRARESVEILLSQWLQLP
ncbi:unnamed protein product [Leptosia nina]|uniref:Serine protease K12H4.7 n=1 Tax=Leptosia nina TaxID=320188 RepID=A0AAV1K160_9NEOP